VTFGPPDDDRLELSRILRSAGAMLFGETQEPLKVGRFVVERKIGAGGLGTVYAARDPDLDRVVALKVLRRGDGISEARAMARLQHPNVVAVHEVGVDEGRVYLAMELVDGVTLREAASFDALVQAGRGIAAAHRAGLVHRDFKPENVLVGKDGRVRVTDFGLAASPGARAFGGTPRYMAPEQRVGGEVGPAADQYAFCVTARELLGAVSPKIDRVLTRGMSVQASERFASMDELLDALSDAAKPTRTLAAVVAVIAAVVVIGAAVLQMWMFADWRSAVREKRVDGGPP
jgi:eukaryotic-like serine/threonine-protein kinase